MAVDYSTRISKLQELIRRERGVSISDNANDWCALGAAGRNCKNRADRKTTLSARAVTGYKSGKGVKETIGGFPCLRAPVMMKAILSGRRLNELLDSNAGRHWSL
jgi:hypothetical protein